MVKHGLRLPDGTWLSSGAEAVNAISRVQLTQSVNAATQLDIGSVCASELQVTLLTPGGEFGLQAGSEITLYRWEGEEDPQPAGVFLLEKPTRPTANTMKLTGYDRIVKLDKDLTAWLENLTGWPYRLTEFAAMVCRQCGVTFVAEDCPNKDFSVERFSASGVTGRQLMRWLGQIACSFCYADVEGNIRFGWYETLTTHALAPGEGVYETVFADMEGVTLRSPEISENYEGAHLSLDSDALVITDDGDGNVTITVPGQLQTLRYRQNGLQFEDYSVRPVDRVQLQLGSGDSAYLWPTAYEDENCYVIKNNPMLNRADEAAGIALAAIGQRLGQVSYTPGKAELPACLQIRPGNVITVTDKNGKTLTMYAMNVKLEGQKLTVSATGSHLHSDPEAVYDHNNVQSAQQVLNGQTQQALFDKLTENGKLQGIYMEDGQLYINASYLKSGILDAQQIQVINLAAEKLRSETETSRLEVDGATLRLQDKTRGETFGVQNYPDGVAYLYMQQYDENGGDLGRCQLGANRLHLGGTWAQPVLGLNILNGNPRLKLGDVEKTLYWHKNTDGTYTLMGK